MMMMTMRMTSKVVIVMMIVMMIVMTNMPMRMMIVEIKLPKAVIMPRKRTRKRNYHQKEKNVN